ncbi:SDR family oxidoreductase [Halovenus sp. HT40]|uniref:SDR family oxidoreductase n=1 Tax=Halovenus sp. HT40 TaxID=3126691 RepID=UPI00300F4A6A
MVTTLLTGATGTLGNAVEPRLHAADHDVRAASRSPPADRATGSSDSTDWVAVDLADGTGIGEAVDGVDTIIHAATAPTGDSEAVDLSGTKRLLDAADAAGIEHFLYVSIVGVDEIPYSYYEYKHAAEDAVEESSVPSTILRSTQFHSFLDDLLGALVWLPLWPLPTELQLQPIAVEEAADEVVELATAGPGGRVDPIGGPTVHTLGDLLSTYRDVRGRWRPIVRIPIPGATMRAVRSGSATCPDRSVGVVSWEQWLEQQYGSQTAKSPKKTAMDW